MTEFATLIASFVLGAVAGSFLNVCIYRIPLGLSIVFPASRCASCEAPIAFYDNIPIVSYMVLGGRCRRCKTPYSAKYPLVEALTGLFSVLLFLRFGLTVEYLVYFVFVSSLIVITFIDLKHQIIPNVISMPGIPIGLACSLVLPAPGVAGSLAGIALGAGVLLGIATAYLFLTGAEGMGMGDVKLLAMIGAFLGWKGVIVTLMSGSFIGALAGASLMLLRAKDSRHPIPFGPFLASGAVLYLFWGEAIISWYITKAVG